LGESGGKRITLGRSVIRGECRLLENSRGKNQRQEREILDEGFVNNWGDTES